MFLYFSKIGRGRMRTKFKKIEPLVFRSMFFCADGFGRFFEFPRTSENWENCKKIADEIRGFFVFSSASSLQIEYDALQILVGRGT